jgi:putative addiction module component (TIGR02574 family)
MLGEVNDRVGEILKAALELTADERERLAYELLDSVEGGLSPEEQAAIDVAWAEEVERRIAEAEGGRTRAEPWETVKARLLESFRR